MGFINILVLEREKRETQREVLLEELGKRKVVKLRVMAFYEFEANMYSRKIHELPHCTANSQLHAKEANGTTRTRQ